MVEMAEIFHRYGSQYRARYGDEMLPSHRKVMCDIERCRTAELGGHVYTCEECEETLYQYHSCRNRHCPKCQNGKAQQWLEKQQNLLLNIPYFMLTFTLPSELRRVARSHQKLFYHGCCLSACSSAPRRTPSRSWLRTHASWAGGWVWWACSTLGGAT